jgi:hypothetical protein
MAQIALVPSGRSPTQDGKDLGFGPPATGALLQRSMPRRALAAALSLALAGCVDSVDRAAKKRIFSPEEPPKAKRAAAEPIDARELARDAGLVYRVTTMSAAEAFERVGPFRYSASASFEWSLGRDKVKLSETRSLEQATGTDFALKTENDRDQGLEVVRVGPRTFAKGKYHKFRERKRDRGRADLLRDDVFGAMKSAQAILDNRLGVAPDGEEPVRGRPARRYLFVLAKEPLRERSADDRGLPKVQFPAGGPDQPTKRRLDFRNLRSPKRVEGKLWVDAETGVPLKAELSAQVSTPGEDKDEALLVLKVKSELKPATDLVVAAPREFLPDEDRPNGIARTLDRFDVGRPDAGAGEARPKPSEPEDAADEP